MKYNSLLSNLLLLFINFFKKSFVFDQILIKPILNHLFNKKQGIRFLIIICLSFYCVSCSSVGTYDNPIEESSGAKRRRAAKQPPGTIWGDEGLQLFGKTDQPTDENTGNGIGVNSFLWRAAIDTLAFMPLASADPFGGVIITDWYSPPESPNERFKVNVRILSRDLRADGISASVFRQEKTGEEWLDSNVSNDTLTNLENAILVKARELRIAQNGE
ncbi:MAG: DUF3576 domain-containing protein [Alphaproteobacteria bacterium]|nr:DUF3576 domain-containing protein [Alphaproteobacteria bacterium]